MLIEEKKLTVVCIGSRGLADTLYMHHVHQPRQVSKESASVQPVVVACNSGLKLCRFQFAVILVILVLIIFCVVIVFLAFTCCIVGISWNAVVCRICLGCFAAFLKHLLFSVSIVSTRMF